MFRRNPLTKLLLFLSLIVIFGEFFSLVLLKKENSSLSEALSVSQSDLEKTRVLLDKKTTEADSNLSQMRAAMISASNAEREYSYIKDYRDVYDPDSFGVYGYGLVIKKTPSFGMWSCEMNDVELDDGWRFFATCTFGVCNNRLDNCNDSVNTTTQTITNLNLYNQAEILIGSSNKTDIDFNDYYSITPKKKIRYKYKMENVKSGGKYTLYVFTFFSPKPLQRQFNYSEDVPYGKYQLTFKTFDDVDEQKIVDLAEETMDAFTYIY